MAELAPTLFADPGPLRDRLVEAILDRRKTSTTSLRADYDADGETLPRPGQRCAVVDSDLRRVTVIEVTSVRVVDLSSVDLAHGRDEGEPEQTVARWRASHEAY